MRFGHLIEYNVNTYFEKSYRESGGEAGLRPFQKNSKFEPGSLDQQSEILIEHILKRYQNISEK